MEGEAYTQLGQKKPPIHALSFLLFLYAIIFPIINFLLGFMIGMKAFSPNLNPGCSTPAIGWSRACSLFLIAGAIFSPIVYFYGRTRSFKIGYLCEGLLIFARLIIYIGLCFTFLRQQYCGNLNFYVGIFLVYMTLIFAAIIFFLLDQFLVQCCSCWNSCSEVVHDILDKCMSHCYPSYFASS